MDQKQLIQVVVSDLRTAAGVFQTSAVTVQQAVNAANGLMGSLDSRGFGRGGGIGDIGAALNDFANKLNAAAKAFEDAGSGFNSPGGPVIPIKHPPIGINDPTDPGGPSKPPKKPTPIPPPVSSPIQPTPDPGDNDHGKIDLGKNDGGNNSGDNSGNDRGSNGNTGGQWDMGQNGGDTGGTGTGKRTGTGINLDGTTGNQRTIVGSDGVTYLVTTMGLVALRGTGKDKNEDDDESDPHFVSKANNALRSKLAESEAALADANTQLDTLQERRSKQAAQLTDLRTLLAAHGGSDPALEQAIKVVETQNTALDAQIIATQDSIADLSSDARNLRLRLNRVAPGAGANLQLIASLEGTQTSEAILRATYHENNAVNCVNWVCSQMPIPPGIAGNAQDWVQNALHHPEYGIRVGDQPLGGSVIVMQPEHSYADDRFGHVMYVDHVDSSGVWVSDNTHHEPVLLSRLTKEVTGPNINYLYFPWQTMA